jgi:hypothetical protein
MDCSPPAPLDALVQAVQRNCDRVDALHAADAGLCTYLLGMREFFRWERGLPLGGAPPSPEVRSWITEREALWDRCLAGEEGPRPLPLDCELADAWDEERVNRWLAPLGLAYGAGIGRFGAPVFFLARRMDDHPLGAPHVTIVDEEFARGFVAPPATSRSGRITIRIDALRRWIWTRAEEGWRGDPAAGFGRVLRAYGDGPPEPGNGELVERIVQDQVRPLLLHEQGEIRAGELLGEGWERMLADAPDRKAETRARALRDLLADCLVTLPVLAAQGDAPAIEFWFATLDGMRRQIADEVLPGIRHRGAIDVASLADAAGRACAVLAGLCAVRQPG